MRRIPIVALALSITVLLAGCREPDSDAHVIDEPMTLSETTNEAGDEVMRIELTARAAERVGIETAPVTWRGRTGLVPSDAVFMDNRGDYWVYTVPEPLVYVREAIAVTNEEGERTFIARGPAVGTEVVTVGVPELWGAETGIDH